MVGCPIDHEDNSKRWCSTKVDSNGNHIANQNEYGYCADDCPTSDGEDIIIDETTEILLWMILLQRVSQLYVIYLFMLKKNMIHIKK